MAKKSKPHANNVRKAKSVINLALGVSEIEDNRTPAQILGSAGGKKGGPARAKALSSKRRKEIAQKAAAARWGHRN